MKKKSLKETNPYLKDPLLREELILRSVISSSAVEGIRPSKEDVARLKELAAIRKAKQSDKNKK
jgi:Fic family protein